MDHGGMSTFSLSSPDFKRQKNGRTSTGKRRREDGERAKSRVRSGERNLRIVVPSRQIGKKPRPPSKSPTLFAEDESNTEATKVAVGHIAANMLPALCASAHESDGVVQVSFCSNCLSLVVSMESSIISH
ncbi:hypothetical protein Q3G72_030256 [Acer saccharum]|nr:hypothetical protein Q3G72_030256 [Acer saccharum]